MEVPSLEARDASSSLKEYSNKAHNVMLKRWLEEPMKDGPWSAYNAGRALVHEEATSCSRKNGKL